MRGTRDTRTNLYMLNLTQQNKLMTYSTTPDEYFAGSAYNCKPKSTLVEYHHVSFYSPTQSGWGKAITENFITSWSGLLFDLVHKQILKNNQPYLGTFSNLEKASDQHRKRLSNQSQIQNKTSSHHPCSQNTPILSSSKQWIYQGKFTRTKQERS